MTDAALTWRRARGSPALHPGELHLWRAWLDVSADERERLSRTLAAAEVERARRLRPLAARRRFVTARAFLRGILGRYLGLPAYAVALVAGPNGKPELASPRRAPALWFNHARSGDLALFSISATGPVGVDVERVCPDLDWRPVAALLAPAERDAIDRLPADERRAAFFRCWTRKEACLKATGHGLGVPLDAFEVPVDPDRPARVGPWRLDAYEPASGYVAAVAAPGPSLRIACWDWTR